MNAHSSVNDPSLMKFGLGQPALRHEDPTLVRGEGRYTDEVALEGQLFGVFVRSAHPHCVIRAIETSAALAIEGVIGVFTGADLEPCKYDPLKSLVSFPNRDGTPMRAPKRQAFALDRVRFVGDPVALVVASSAALAIEATELVVVDIDSLPVVVSVEEALAAGAPQLFEAVPGVIVESSRNRTLRI